MKPYHAIARVRGFTVWDLLIVAVTLVPLVSVGLPYINRPRSAQQTTSAQANRQLLSAFQVTTQSALRFAFP